MSQVKVKRRIPSPKDLAQLLRFRKIILSPRKRRLTRALTIYDLRDIAKRRTPQAPFDYTDGGSLETLSIEMIFALIPSATYLFYLVSKNEAQYGSELWFSLILMTSGLVTVIPLLMFNSAATSLPLTITGLLGYINPKILEKVSGS